MVTDELGCGPQQDVGRLERLNPPGEHEHDRVRRDAEVAPGQPPRPGPEGGQVHPGADRRDPAGRRVVELDQLARLGVGVGNDPVSGGDDLGLAADPEIWLGSVAPREGGVLDLAKSVHGLDERHAPAFLGHRSDLPG